MTKTNVTPYEDCHIYILDNPPPSHEEASDFEERSAHDQKNGNIEKLFRKHSDYEVHNVAFQKGSASGVVLKYLKELESMKQRQELSKQRELMVIYYHGGAGNNGSSYTWYVYVPPTRKTQTAICSQ